MKLLKPLLISALFIGMIPEALAVDLSEAYGTPSIEERLRIYKNINDQISRELEKGTLGYEEEEEAVNVSSRENIVDYTLISEGEENYDGYVLAKSSIKSEDIINAKSLSKEAAPVSENEEETGLIGGLWNKFKYNTSETWNNPSNYSLTIPFYAWHNRLAYDKEKYTEYNELAWGIGFSMARYDEDDDWHSLYAMVFEDSNHHPETMFGYAYQNRWYFDDEHDWFAGAGFTLGLTQRCEYMYIPVPLPLPLFSFGHRKFNVNMAYVPGIKNDGNVAFFFANYEF